MILHHPLPVPTLEGAVDIACIGILVVGHNETLVGIGAQRLFSREIGHPGRNPAGIHYPARILDVNVVIRIAPFAQRRSLEGIVVLGHYRGEVPHGFRQDAGVIGRIQLRHDELGQGQVHFSVVVHQYARINVTQFFPVQGNGAGVRVRAFRSVGIQDEDFVVIGAGDHVELSGLRILEHIRRPQADATALYLFGDILQVQGFSCIGPVKQVIGPEHVVIVGAPFPPAIRSIAVVVVPRAEDIHATVKNMGFTIGNEQFPAGGQDGILGQITHGDQATVFLPGLGIGGKNPDIAGR